MKKIVLILVIVVLLLFITYRILQYSAEKNKSVVKINTEASLPVRVVPVKPGAIEETITYTGDIYGQNEVKVYTKVPGKLNEKVKREGDYVETGTVIAKVNRDEPGMDYTLAEVKSPIAGVITKFYTDVGESVFPAMGMASVPVVSVADMTKVRIVIYVTESEINQVRNGQQSRVYVDSFPGRGFMGLVKNIAPSIDPMTRKFKVEIEVANNERTLKPGMFVKVSLIIRSRTNIITLPRIAVLEHQGKQAVFVVNNGIAKQQVVELGIVTADRVEIVRGLELGQLVVTEGNYILGDGMQVQIQD